MHTDAPALICADRPSATLPLLRRAWRGWMLGWGAYPGADPELVGHYPTGCAPACPVAGQ